MQLGARDILGEAARLQGGKRSRAAPELGPIQPSYPPPLDDHVWEALVADLESAQVAFGDGLLVLSVGDDLIDRHMTNGDDEQLVLLHLMGGTYFNTELMLGGHVVWKSRTAPLNTTDPVYIFVHEGGWYVSTVLFQTISKRDKHHSSHLAFGKMQPGRKAPEKLHFPYWEAKTCPYLMIEDVLEYVDKRNGVRDSELEFMLLDRDQKAEAAQSCLENILHLEKQIEEYQKAEAYKPTGSCSSQQWLAQPQPDGSEKGGDGKGKGKKEKSRSGWIPKVAPLLAAYWDEDWPRLKSLAAGLYSGSEILATLVDQQVRKKRR